MDVLDKGTIELLDKLNLMGLQDWSLEDQKSMGFNTGIL